MSSRNDPVSSAMARSRNAEKGDHSKEEMAVSADVATLVDGKGGAGSRWRVGGWRGRSRSWVMLSYDLIIEPESMVNLPFVKNDSYEKGPDSVVVHVYVKEICREASRVLFREQDFTLIFQTRWVGKRGGRQCAWGQAVCLMLFSLPCFSGLFAGMETS